MADGFDARRAKKLHADRERIRAKRAKAKQARAKKYTKSSGVYATPSGFVAKAGASRQSVVKAAEVYLAQVRKNASRMAKGGRPASRIVLYTDVVELGEQSVEIVTDGALAPNAAPFEFGERHPVYGRKDVPRNEWTWRKQPTRAYMSNAARNKTVQQKAADIYAQEELDLLAKEYGWDKLVGRNHYGGSSRRV